MNKREGNRYKKVPAGNKQSLQLIAIVTVFAVVIAALLIIPNLPKSVGEITLPEPITRPMVNGPAIGDPSAPVKVEEYADFQCPYCAQFALEFEPQFIKDYVETKKVSLQFFMFSFLGNESDAAAQATFCALDQGKFWEYHDVVFANQNGENQGWFTTDRLIAFGEKIGLDTTAFRDCLRSGKYKDRVAQETTQGRQRGITATPGFVVNGKPVYWKELIATIEEELAKSAPK